MSVIAVWFSCGAASAVAAKKTLELYPNDEIHIVNNPIKEEHEDNKRFLLDVEKWLGVKIEYAINDKYPSCSCKDVWNDRKYMSGVAGAACTYQLKKMARQQYEDNHDIDYHVLGFAAEEVKRANDLKARELPELITPLIDLNISKEDCFQIIQKAGIKLPYIYKWLYNANCIGCVKASSPTYWNTIRIIAPEIFLDRAVQSRKLGVKLVQVKGKRIYLDELDPNTKGRPLKKVSVECGIFCEDYHGS